MVDHCQGLLIEEAHQEQDQLMENQIVYQEREIHATHARVKSPLPAQTIFHVAHPKPLRLICQRHQSWMINFSTMKTTEFSFRVIYGSLNLGFPRTSSNFTSKFRSVPSATLRTSFRSMVNQLCLSVSESLKEPFHMQSIRIPMSNQDQLSQSQRKKTSSSITCLKSF